MNEGLKFKGRYEVAYKDATGLLIAERVIENLTPNIMVQHMFDAVFGGVTQVNPWYIGLINNTPTPGLSTADTLASHAGWVEFTSYSGNRKEWTDAAAATRSKTSSAPSVFTLTGSGTLYGCFLSSAASGTSGTLGSEGAFDLPLPVGSGGTLNVVFTITAL